MVERRVVILREKGVMEYGKTEAAVEENVSLPSGSTRKRGNRKEGGRTGVSGWRSREKYRREEETKKRERERHTRRREEKKRQNRRNGSAGLSRTSFIFSPRLNIKDNLIIGGFSKAGRAHFLARLSVSLYASFSFLSPFSGISVRSSVLSVDDMKVLEARRKKTRYMYIATYHRICRDLRGHR